MYKVIIAIVISILVSMVIAIVLIVLPRVIFPKPQVLSGTTNPTTQGSNGDFYLNTMTNTLFGPKGVVTTDV